MYTSRGETFFMVRVCGFSSGAIETKNIFLFSAQRSVTVLKISNVFKFLKVRDLDAYIGYLLNTNQSFYYCKYTSRNLRKIFRNLLLLRENVK